MKRALNLIEIRNGLAVLFFGLAVLMLVPGSVKALPQEAASVQLTELPPEARSVMQLIKQGGPFPYPRDGVVFGNYEKRLPRQPRGYYREYTVKTPGARNRGARRIVCGRAADCYYTDDHYNTFRHIRE